MAGVGIINETLIGGGADAATSPEVQCLGCTHLTGYVVTSNATVSAGAVTFEHTSWGGDTPRGSGGVPPGTTWELMGSGAVTPVQNDTVAVVFAVGSYHYVRARISTAVTGGATVTVRLVGAP